MDNGIGNYQNNIFNGFETGKFKHAGQTAEAFDAGRINIQGGDVFSKNPGVNSETDTAAATPAEITAKQFVSNALKEAGIAINERTAQLVEALLENRQSVDKNNLQLFNRLIKMFPNTDVNTLVNMKLKNIPVSNEMITQYEQYRDNTHYIMKDLASITDNFGNVLKSAVLSGGREAALSQLDGIANLIKDMSGFDGNELDLAEGKSLFEMGMEKSGFSDNAAGTEALYRKDMAGTVEEDLGASEKSMSDSAEPSAYGKAAEEAKTGGNADIFENADGVVRMAAGGDDKTVDYRETSKDVLRALNELEREAEDIAGSRTEVKGNGEFFKKLMETAKRLSHDEDMVKLFEKSDIKKSIRKELEKSLLLEPKDAAELDKVQKYYKKLQKALENYEKAAERQMAETGKSEVVKTFQNMSDNLNFMHYMNGLMPYVQLPIKLLDENAHGDFYVMQGRKNKNGQNGEFTAYLKLDMEQLGKLDIFIKLKNINADISFKVENEGICEFIKNNIPMLEAGLESKGYRLISHVDVNDKEHEKAFIDEFFESEGEAAAFGAIEKYSFDVKT